LSQHQRHTFRIVVSAALSCVFSHALLAQVTAPPLPNAPAQPDWSDQRTSQFRPQHPMPHAMEQLRRDAGQVAPAINHNEARRLLLGTSWLPVMDPLLVYTTPTQSLAVTQSQFDALPVELRSSNTWTGARFDSYAMYYPAVRSPIWSVRAADILVQRLATIASTAEANATTEEQRKQAAEVPLRGKHILLVSSESFVLGRLLAGQGATVTLIMPVSNAVDAALQTDAKWQGVVQGHGMGEQIAPDGTLRIIPWRTTEGETRDWARDVVVQSALAQQCEAFGPLDCALVIETNASATPEDLSPLFAKLQASSQTTLFDHTTTLLWYAMVDSPEEAQRLEGIVPAGAGGGKPGEDGFAPVDDSVAIQTIAKNLGWDSANNPVELVHCQGRYQFVPVPATR